MSIDFNGRAWTGCTRKTHCDESSFNWSYVVVAIQWCELVLDVPDLLGKRSCNQPALAPIGDVPFCITPIGQCGTGPIGGGISVPQGISVSQGRQAMGVIRAMGTQQGSEASDFAHPSLEKSWSVVFLVVVRSACGCS